jgi:glyoxylase-like metal-dependent hydrolase (beta-lactamase superfamily II)
MQFLTLDRDAFTYGLAAPIAPLVRRVVAENPSKFTYHGTGTYIVGGDTAGRGDVVVIDPGPRLDSHRDALAAALTGCTVRAILITHCHADHSPLAAWLAAETGASTFAFGPHGDDTWDIGDDPPEVVAAEAREAAERRARAEEDGVAGLTDEPVIEESTDREFTPDVAVGSGSVVASGDGWTITALHTPGHTSNHTCYVLDGGDSRTIFTGDHVMGWSTTVVSPPDGDMAEYLESLRLVAGRSDDLAIPTHGPPIPNPSTFVAELIHHRLDRERNVLDAVRAGLDTIPAIVELLYVDVRRELFKPARRSVLAHLVKLVDDGVVDVEGAGLPRLDATYRPV